MNLITLGSYLLHEGERAGIDPDRLIKRMMEMVREHNREIEAAGEEMMARLREEGEDEDNRQ